MSKAIILCAGEGKRLLPLTAKCLKPMLRLKSAPLLEYNIKLLKGYGITDLAINLHYFPEQVIRYFGDGSKFGVKLRYSLENKPLGTAGALKKIADFFDRTFVVIYGDLLTDVNLKKMMDFHRFKKGMATVGLYHVNNPTECGLVGMDQNNRIKGFVEKPTRKRVFTDIANAGVYILEPEIIDYIPKNKFYDFGRHLFPKLLRDKKPLYGYTINEYLIDIGTKEKYKEAKEDFKKGRVKC